MAIASLHSREISTLPLLHESDADNSVEALCEQLKTRESWIAEMLAEHGGILFRGYALTSPEAFQAAAQASISSLKPYVKGQSPRSKVADNVYTSTEHPDRYSITLHNELSYAKSPPPRIAFFCLVEPTQGGETPIVDCRAIYHHVPASIREAFETKGVRYVKNMHGDKNGLGKSWMDHFETDDRNVVESYLTQNDIDFEWLNDGSLRTSANRPGVIDHPLTGDRIWFNQANLWHVTNVDQRHREQLIRRCGIDGLPTHAFYGDGSPIDDDDLDQVRQVMWDNSVISPWRQGDFLLLDNFMVAHGRMPFEGPRKILVAMG
ncbi:MAG: TauD/TfdA family dioxygenase [Planctomycetota bacterium]|nr:TauD/TfdA family dioxygenase [Planctomycetota bacterium]MDA1212959.1 TauD/TfdA family dioxygenase [Planctomycetota bacterium]